jgi:hypothetical protein
LRFTLTRAAIRTASIAQIIMFLQFFRIYLEHRRTKVYPIESTEYV